MKISKKIICSSILFIFLMMITGAAIAEEVNVEFVCHFGGLVHDVAITGGYAYLGQEQDLVILDIGVIPALLKPDAK